MMRSGLTHILFCCVLQLTYINGFSQVITGLNFNGNINSSGAAIYILGEDHFKQNNIHKEKIIRALLKNQELKTIFLEAPLSYEVFYNDYLKGRNTIIKDLGKYEIRVQHKQEMQLLEIIRKLNEDLPSEKQLTVKCYDVPRTTSLTPFLISMQYLLERWDAKQELEFNKMIIRRLSVPEGNYYDSQNFVRELLYMFKQDSIPSQKILGKEFQTCAEILDGLAISYLYDSNRSETVFDSLREKYMYRQLRARLDTNSGSLITCGNAHASLKEKDTYFDYYTYSSFSFDLKKEYKSALYVIITEYYKPGSLFTIQSLTDLNYKGLFRQTDGFLILAQPDIEKYQGAKERCNMLLIKDCR